MRVGRFFPSVLFCCALCPRRKFFVGEFFINPRLLTLCLRFLSGRLFPRRRHRILSNQPIFRDFGANKIFRTKCPSRIGHSDHTDDEATSPHFPCYAQHVPRNPTSLCNVLKPQRAYSASRSLSRSRPRYTALAGSRVRAKHARGIRNHGLHVAGRPRTRSTTARGTRDERGSSRLSSRSLPAILHAQSATASLLPSLSLRSCQRLFRPLMMITMKIVNCRGRGRLAHACRQARAVDKSRLP